MRGFEDVERWGRHPADERRFGRLHMESTLSCTLGRVLDLSLGGLRVMCRRAPKTNVLDVRLWDSQDGIQTEVRVVWHVRRGFFRHELGLQFPPLDDRSRAFLLRVGERHRFRQSIRDFDLGTRDVA
ncbi:MAG: PilZ domain-containing protein [Phycisphaerales bacterium]